MKNLRLPLLTIWFEMTKSGIKKEDYREINEYWFKRLVLDYKKVFHYYTGHDWSDEKTRELGIEFIAKSNFKNLQFKPFYKNVMTLGYPKSDETEKIIELQHLGIEIRTGKREWGAEPGKLYFVIKHGF